MASTLPVAVPNERVSILRERLKRRDLKHPELRDHYWDQLHPRTGRFRPTYYQKSTPWQVSSETFIETENRKPNFRDWIRGTYHAETTISDSDYDEELLDSQVIIRLGLSLDFTKGPDDCTHWTIDTSAHQTQRAAAYPGIHKGNLLEQNISGQWTYFHIYWKTPIFSPYVQTGASNSGREKEDFIPVVFSSLPKNWGKVEFQTSSLIENVELNGKSPYVNVLQEILKDIAKFLVFGPRYADMKLAPIAEYNEAAPDLRSNTTKSLFESTHFPKVAAFFSRAYCDAGSGKDDELSVPEGNCTSTIETIEVLFDYYKIVREPPWINTCNQDWVDDLREEVMVLKTVSDWRKFERKWATIASYACGLDLHEGPWAGEDWRTYIDEG